MVSVVVETLVVSGVVYFVYLLLKYRNHAIGTSDRSDTRGPKGWPIIGNAVGIVGNGPRNLEWALLRAFQHGPGSSATVPGIRVYDISKPEWIEYIQKTNFHNYVKGTQFQDIVSDLLGKGIFASDGELWNIQRKTTSHIFSARSFEGVITPAITESLTTLQSIITRNADQNRPFDISELFFRLTLESFVKMAFGQGIGALSLDSDIPVPFAVAFDHAQARLEARFTMFVGWSLYEAITGKGAKMREACKVIDDMAYGLIDARRAETSPVQKSEKSPYRDLLGLYMDAHDEKGRPMNREQIKDSVINLIIAGRDTTAQALSWTFFHLIKNQGLLGPLREEIELVLGPGGEVDYSNFRQLVQVQAAFNEALRLHPSVPKNVKFAVANDILPNGGPVVEKGDALRWSDWQMARDPEIWGSDCTEYKPSRWVDEEGKLRQFIQWKFHAFNAGPRLCLGMNLATFEAVQVIACLVKKFDLSFAPGWWESVPKTEGICGEEATPMYGTSLTLPMKAPFMVVAKNRDSV